MFESLPSEPTRPWGMFSKGHEVFEEDTTVFLQGEHEHDEMKLSDSKSIFDGEEKVESAQKCDSLKSISVF